MQSPETGAQTASTDAEAPPTEPNPSETSTNPAPTAGAQKEVTPLENFLNRLLCEGWEVLTDYPPMNPKSFNAEDADPEAGINGPARPRSSVFPGSTKQSGLKIFMKLMKKEILDHVAQQTSDFMRK